MEFLLHNFKKDGILNCFICFEALEDAHFCPHCSKLCCFPCITGWLDKGRNTCPYCNLRLSPSQLIKCRWIADISDLIQKISNEVENKEENETEFEIWRVCHNDCGNCKKCDLEIEREAIEEDKERLMVDQAVISAEKDVIESLKEVLQVQVEEATQKKELLEVEQQIFEDKKKQFEGEKMAFEEERGRFMAMREFEKQIQAFEHQQSTFALDMNKLEEVKVEVEENLEKLNLDKTEAQKIFEDVFKSVKQQNAVDDRYIDLIDNAEIKVTARILLPVVKYPATNFAGKVIGRGGHTIRHLRGVTQCDFKVMCPRNSQEACGNSEEPHVIISTTATPSEAYARISSALKQLKVVIMPEVKQLTREDTPS